MGRKIYLASSWKNEAFPSTVRLLRAQGHEVYNFRNPAPGNEGFQWSQIDLNWTTWDASSYRSALGSRIAQEGFQFDKDGLDWADTCILLLPSGRSAHLEAGYCIGKGKDTIVFIPEYDNPDLMYLLADAICLSWPELIRALGVPK